MCGICLLYTSRIRFCLHRFLGSDTDDYTYEALKLFLPVSYTHLKEFAEHERIAEEKSSDSNVCVEQNEMCIRDRMRIAAWRLRTL